jgi:hypothetical protein
MRQEVMSYDVVMVMVMHSRLGMVGNVILTVK